MARKGWDSLSAKYRARLQKGGISKTKYESGEKLHKARGHISSRHEKKQQRFWRLADKQLGQDFDRSEIKEVVDAIGFDDALSILEHRENALHPRDAAERFLGVRAMRTLYGVYAGSVPPQWLYYHGRG